MEFTILSRTYQYREQECSTLPALEIQHDHPRHHSFRTLGLKICQGPKLERGYEKVALYAQQGRQTHTAIQMIDGRWHSRSHRTLKSAWSSGRNLRASLVIHKETQVG